jgi:hypothetical protein
VAQAGDRGPEIVLDMGNISALRGQFAKARQSYTQFLKISASHPVRFTLDVAELCLRTFLPVMAWM